MPPFLAIKSHFEHAQGVGWLGGEKREKTLALRREGWKVIKRRRFESLLGGKCREETNGFKKGERKVSFFG